MLFARSVGSHKANFTMHPAFLHEESGAMTTFADARVGMEVTMLTAAPESLAKFISASAKTLINDSLAPRGSSLRSEAASAFEPREVVGLLHPSLRDDDYVGRFF